MLVDNNAKLIYMVMDGTTLQGIFEDEALANQFKEKFPNATVEPEFLYTAMPKFYTWEARLALHTGAVLDVKECKPSFDRILLQIDRNTVMALGEGREEAIANAQEFRKRVLEDRTEKKTAK